MTVIQSASHIFISFYHNSTHWGGVCNPTPSLMMTTWKMLTGQNCQKAKRRNKLKHTHCRSVSTDSQGRSQSCVPPPWGIVQWLCMWRLAASCLVCVAGCWWVPHFPQSTGPSLMWATVCWPLLTSTPTCGRTAPRTLPGCPTVRNTPPCWAFLVRYTKD